MCGIAGFTGFEDKELLKRMCDIQTHRGPDDYGFYIDKNISLGHRRLSIIDLKTGKQPIHNEDESIWVVYNGEIYNFKELRKDLQQRGHRFYTNTDTEVIVHQYEEEGEKCVEKFRGMFAFGLWDSNKKKLFLARDRLGVKPLHYAVVNGKFLFASEIKAVLLCPDVKREIDTFALDCFLTYKYIPAPYTIFKSIKKLLPGHYLVYHEGKVSTKEYWDLIFVEGTEKSENYYIYELKRLLEEATRIRLISDVPLGAFLSGGIDSSTVVGMMSKVSEEPIKTFSVGFDIEEYDELKYAKVVAEHFGTEHHEFVVEPKALEVLPKIIWQLDEPFADSSAIPTYYVSKIASKYIKVVLSGDGGDEMFGGYPWYLTKPTDKIAFYFQKFPKITQNSVLKISDFLPEIGKLGLIKRVLNLASLSNEERFIARRHIFNENSKKPDEILKFYFKKTNAVNPLNKYFYVDIKTYLGDDILVKVDKMSMLNSIEARAPFLDYKLEEFSATIPPSLKVRGDTTKYIFKKAVSDLLPQEIIKRKKWGFTIPLHIWFGKDLQQVPFELLQNSNRDYFNRGYINKILQKFKKDNQIYISKIWHLMVLELWLRTYIDRDEVEKPLKKII